MLSVECGRMKRTFNTNGGKSETESDLERIVRVARVASTLVRHIALGVVFFMEVFWLEVTIRAQWCRTSCVAS